MEYPKALYKGGVLLAEGESDAVTVQDAEAEKAAKADGYLAFDREASNAAALKFAEPEAEQAVPAEEKRKPGRPRKTEA